MPVLDSLSTSASYVRQNWSTTIDSVVHSRPVFVKRTHDNITMMDSRLLQYLLLSLTFHVDIETEDDGSVTCFLKELDLVENAPSEDICLDKLIEGMKDYAQDFYNDFSFWSGAPNRKTHIPYVLKILSGDDEDIRRSIVCQGGKN